MIKRLTQKKENFTRIDIQYDLNRKGIRSAVKEQVERFGSKLVKVGANLFYFRGQNRNGVKLSDTEVSGKASERGIKWSEVEILMRTIFLYPKFAIRR